MKKNKVEFKLKKLLDFEIITNSILPKDDSALYFTETNFILDTSIEIATEDLYNTIVHQAIIK